MHWGSESTESLLEEGPGLVQMFDQSSLWEEIGYHVAAGSLEDGKHVILERTSKSSPEFLESHSDIDDLIMFKQFDSKEEQDQWVANEIQTNLTEDELRPDDIIVINPTPSRPNQTLRLFGHFYIKRAFSLTQLV